MPWSQKTHNFMEGCAHGMHPTGGRKCPSKATAAKMAGEGIKGKRHWAKGKRHHGSRP